MTPAVSRKGAHRPALKKAARKRLIQVSVFVGAIALWWAIARFAQIDPVILPGPDAVVGEVIDGNRCVESASGSGRVNCGVQGYFLWQHLLATVQRIAVGLGAGVLVGVLLGWVLVSNSIIRSVVEPYVTFLRALPPLGYIGLLIVWFGSGDTSKIVLLFLASFPAVAIATLTGVIGVPKSWGLSVQTLGASRFQVLRDATVPGAAPSIIVGIRLAAGLAWASIVAAEMNDGIPGIGGLAYISGTQLDTALTIACIVIIGITALAFDQLLVALERKVAPWQGKQ